MENKQKPLGKRPWRHTVFWLALAAAVALAITLFSAQTGDQSEGLSRSIARWLVRVLPLSGTTAGCNHLLRKCAHFGLYFALGFCVTGFLRRRAFAFPAAVTLCGLYAAFDELHQRFVAGRGPQLSDVLLDTCGAAAGSAVLLLLLSLRRRRGGRTRGDEPC